MEEAYALDLEELKHLQTIAKRPRVLTLISNEILKLSKDVAPAPAPAAGIQVPRASTAPKVQTKPTSIYTTLGSFSYDQDSDKLKIYVSLEGVNETDIESEFKPWSFDVKFHNVQGKNYRCAIPKLNKKIDPEKCKVVVKPKRVIIVLAKASIGNWLDLYYKEDKLKSNLDKEKDPMAGIMDMMKNMYEDGDEDMKRTIAKAWTDARSGKTADPLKSFN